MCSCVTRALFPNRSIAREGRRRTKSYKGAIFEGQVKKGTD